MGRTLGRHFAFVVFAGSMFFYTAEASAGPSPIVTATPVAHESYFPMSSPTPRPTATTPQATATTTPRATATRSPAPTPTATYTATPTPSPTPAALAVCPFITVECSATAQSASYQVYPTCKVILPAKACTDLGLPPGRHEPAVLNAIDCNNLTPPEPLPPPPPVKEYSVMQTASSDERMLDLVLECCSMKHEVSHATDPVLSASRITPPKLACTEGKADGVSSACVASFAEKTCTNDPRSSLCVEACKSTDIINKGEAFDTCFCDAFKDENGQIDPGITLGWDTCGACHDQCVQDDLSSRLPKSCPDLSGTTVTDPASGTTLPYPQAIYKLCDYMANSDGRTGHTCASYVTEEIICYDSYSCR